MIQEGQQLPPDYERWPKIFRDCYESGLSRSEWCRQNGLSHGQFNSRMSVARRNGINIQIPRRNQEFSFSEETKAQADQPSGKSDFLAPMLKDMSREGRVHMVGGLVCRGTSTEKLRSILEYRLKADPKNGDWFLFRARQARTLHALRWDGDGFIHLKKKTELGYYRWNQQKGMTRLTPEDIDDLLFPAQRTRSTAKRLNCNEIVMDRT